MNPLMDILRQQRASKRPGYRYGAPVGNPMGGTADSSSSSSNSSSSNTGLGGQYGLGAGEDAPGTGEYAGAQGLGINSSTNPNQGVHNPHLDTPDISVTTPDPGTDNENEKTQWGWYNNLTNFFNKYAPKLALGLVTSLINPAATFGLKGLLATTVNAGIMNSMMSPSEAEQAQADVDEAQAVVDRGWEPGIAQSEQSLNDAMASLSSAQASEAEAAEAAAEAAEREDRGRNTPDTYLAYNPYQGNPISYQGSMGPVPDYSQYTLSHDEQSMADSLEAIGYAPHTAVQYAMHYFNNPEAPAFT